MDIRKDGAGRARVRIIPMERFANGHPIRIERRSQDVSQGAVLARAGGVLALQGMRYDAFLANCEHLARRVSRGSRESRQSQGYGLLMVLVHVCGVVGIECRPATAGRGTFGAIDTSGSA